MMQLLHALSAVLFAGVALSLPSGEYPQLDTRQLSSDNCTEYTSVAAGSVCIHIPYDCDATYIVEGGDTCKSIGEKFGNFSLTQFYKWNPDITRSCLALRAFVPVCVSTPWYTLAPPSAVQAPAGAIVPASATPVPVMPGAAPSCAAYLLVGPGVRVDAVVTAAAISLEEFLEWNANVDPEFPTVWSDYFVCVGVEEEEEGEEGGDGEAGAEY
ncbi:hypothetical protein BDY21DRAFT_397756 [Lineolata rhizophorae]|uniref:LysM domain-containing protein n=1 Tax=Lineolata rhizophorae TaxID=578093 RepID=A0A6A6PBU8_9PEZI|nr:hypothetical protein BDY21DRAFT_397756 [Lineolata rhizophorae]